MITRVIDLRGALTGGAALALALSLLTGCSEADQSGTADTADTADRCAQYEDLVAQAEELRSWDPQTDEVEELQAQAEDVVAELDDLQAVADGRVDSAITAMRAAVDDFRDSVAEQGQEAKDAVQPALQDARERIEEAVSVVALVVENQCGDS